MSFKNLKTNEVALLLFGLRAVYVADEVKTHEKLSEQLEKELSTRGFRLPNPDEVNRITLR